MLTLWLTICFVIGISWPFLMPTIIETARAISGRVSRMGILGMWVPDPIKREAKLQASMAERALKAASQSCSKELALPEDPVPVYELYDHPAPPIALLGASLPTAPIGYGWEIHILPNDEGNPALRLAMLDLKTSMVIDAIEGDLVIVRRWKYANDDTYASFYRRAKDQVAKEVTGFQVTDKYGRGGNLIYGKDPQEFMGKVMMANLITPMVDWARLITLRYIVEHPDETKCNYMLIENMAEASA